MDKTIVLAGLLLVTSLTGTLGLLVWRIVRRPLERWGSLRWCQVGLWAVAVLYLVPAAFGIMVWRVGRFVSWGGVLFLPTPFLIRFCRAIDLMWFLGILILGGRLTGELLALRHLVHISRDCGGWERELLEQTCGELGIRAERVRLRRSVHVQAPAFAGIWHPTVLLPEMEFNREQLRALLLHELTHYKQKDYELLLLVQAARTLHFWNPFAWRLKGLAEQWSEFACDARACERAGGMKCYYGAIAEFVEAASQKQPAMTAHLAYSQCGIPQRMIHIKEARGIKPRPCLGWLLFGAALLLSGALSAAAVEGVGKGYQKWYQSTMAEKELLQYSRWEHELYEDDGPASYLTVEEGEEETRGLLHLIPETVPRKTTVLLPEFTAREGGQIAVTVYVRPTEGGGNLKAGLMDSTGSRTYISEDDVINHVFCIPKAGTYRVFLENQHFAPIGAQGAYRIL